MAAFRHRDYTLFWFSRVFSALAIEMQITAVGWQVYRITGEALDLGLVGLAQFGPLAALFLVTGMVADRFPRVRILAICIFVQALCATAFLAMTLSGIGRFDLIFLILLVFGIARAFQQPASQSVIPTLVPRDIMANAIAWGSSGMQMARIAGPAVAGIMIAAGTVAGVHEVPVYALATVLFIVATVLSALIRTGGQLISKAPVTIETLLVGLRFIRSRQVILGAVGLDLFAVLFGGAVALLPIYAKDILQVGAEGFGILRSVFMVGAFLAALYLTQRPLRRHAGPTLLICVAVFGLGVIVFGASQNFWLSLAALAIMGTADSISVFIRNNLVQIITPEDMLGRVSAVTGVFVGASNELGEFESGVTAHWWGTVPAVIVGGVATVVVVGIFTLTMPKLRSVDSLDPDELIRRYRNPENPEGPA